MVAYIRFQSRAVMRLLKQSVILRVPTRMRHLPRAAAVDH